MKSIQNKIKPDYGRAGMKGKSHSRYVGSLIFGLFLVLLAGAALAQTPGTAMESPLINHSGSGEDRRTLEWGVQNCSETGDGTNPPFFDNCEYVIRRVFDPSTIEEYLRINSERNIVMDKVDNSGFGPATITTLVGRGNVNVSQKGEVQNNVEEEITTSIDGSGIDISIHQEVISDGSPLLDASLNLSPFKILFSNQTELNAAELDMGTGSVFAGLVDADVKAGEVTADEIYTGNFVMQNEFGNGALFASKGTTGGPSLILSSPNNVITLSDNGVHLSSSNNTVTLSGDGVHTTGKVEASRIVTELWEAAPDYVFQEDYYLKPLEEVEAFVKKHKHLPGVPKGSEMEKNGVDITHLNMRLLEKIEELTLHTIEQQKVITNQERRLIALEEKLNASVKE